MSAAFFSLLLLLYLLYAPFCLPTSAAARCLPTLGGAGNVPRLMADHAGWRGLDRIELYQRAHPRLAGRSTRGAHEA